MRDSFADICYGVLFESPLTFCGESSRAILVRLKKNLGEFLSRFCIPIFIPVKIF